MEKGGEYEGKERLRGKKGIADVGWIWPTQKLWHGAPRLWPRAPQSLNPALLRPQREVKKYQPF